MIKRLKKLERRKKNRRGGEEGQVIIEFLIVTSMILTMIFVFVQLAWGIAYGHYVHYATYMASRAYLAGGTTPQDQYDNAVGTLRSMLKRPGGKDLFPFIARARTGDDRDAKGPEPVEGAAIGVHQEAGARPNNRAYSWAEGVQYNFNLRLFLLPLSSFIAKDGEGKTIQPGSAQSPARTIQYKGSIPFTSDSFLGRDPSSSECWTFMTRMSREFGINRQDGKEFVEDNGC